MGLEPAQVTGSRPLAFQPQSPPPGRPLIGSPCHDEYSAKRACGRARSAPDVSRASIPAGGPRHGGYSAGPGGVVPLGVRRGRSAVRVSPGRRPGRPARLVGRACPPRRGVSLAALPGHVGPGGLVSLCGLAAGAAAGWPSRPSVTGDRPAIWPIVAGVSRGTAAGGTAPERSPGRRDLDTLPSRHAAAARAAARRFPPVRGSPQQHGGRRSLCAG